MAIKKAAQTPITEAPSDQYFWANDGKVFKNLNELAEGLEKMPKNAFQHHVNGQKNDFAKWVKDVFKETQLSQSLDKTKTAESMAQKIRTKI